MPLPSNETTGLSTGSLKTNVIGVVATPQFASVLSVALLLSPFSVVAAPPDAPAVSASPSRVVLRNKRRTARAADRTKRDSGIKTIGGGWEIRPSTARGENYVDCVHRNGQSVKCRFGGYSEGFLSRDGGRVVVISPGNPFNPKYGKAATIFDASSGKQLIDVPLSDEGVMAAAANPAANIFVLSHQLSESTLVEAYDLSGTRLWQKTILNQRAQTGFQAVAISGDGKTIFVATSGNPRGAETGRVYVMSSDGSFRGEIPVNSARIVSGQRGRKFAAWNTEGFQVYSTDTDSVVAAETCDGEPQVRCKVAGISPDEKGIVVLRLRDGDFRKKEKTRLVHVDFMNLETNEVERTEVDEEVGHVVRARLSRSKVVEVETQESVIEYEPAP